MDITKKKPRPTMRDYEIMHVLLNGPSAAANIRRLHALKFEEIPLGSIHVVLGIMVDRGFLHAEGTGKRREYYLSDYARNLLTIMNNVDWDKPSGGVGLRLSED